MNTTEAKQILNKFGSTHEHEVGKYYADFNIKVYRPNILSNLTEVEREYVERDIDPYETIRDNLLGDIASLPLTAEVMVTGRTGGWVTVKWAYPSSDAQIIKIAKEIEKIKELVREALAFVRSEQFWRNFVEGVDPTSSKNYNPKTKLVTSIVMYMDEQVGAVLSLTRNGERSYYYHRNGEVSRLLNVLNGSGYDRQAEIGKVSGTLFIRFEKRV